MYKLPFFGFSWNPSQTEHTTAYQIITFLEDRRILYNNIDLEYPNNCFESVCDIRIYLTGKMEDITPDTNLYNYLIAMRIACRKFSNLQFDYTNKRCRINQNFYDELFQLRKTFGTILAQIAVTFSIQLPEFKLIMQLIRTKGM